MPSRRKIQALPENLINQIAAGEVVERPSSAVKELVENSLDAGASRIEVRLVDGGLSEIQIIDDGHGMEPDDLEVAVSRHTTSKLFQLSDLEALRTFGFRGEALAAIASVSDLSIRSRTENVAMAHQLEVSFGKKSPLQPTSGPVGTALTVRNLFEKVPARKKFMRTLATELSHCTQALKEVALGNPGVSFILSHQDRILLRLGATSRGGRVWDCMRYKWPLSDALNLKEETADFSFETFLSPAHLVAEKGEIQVILNNRPIRNRMFQAAAKSAYLEVLGSRHIPSGVIYLDIREDWVDANVHPQKLEVRLLKGERIYPWMLAQIRKALSGSRPHEELDLSPETSRANIQIPFEKETPPLTDLKYLSEFRNRYFLCENREGLLLVDKSALNEASLFETLKEQKQRGPLLMNALRPTLVIQLTAELLHTLEAQIDGLEGLGFQLRLMGETSLGVLSRPKCLPVERVEETLRALLANPNAGLEIIARFASIDAQESSLSQLQNLHHVTTPQGRPVLFHLELSDLKRYFGTP